MSLKWSSWLDYRKKHLQVNAKHANLCLFIFLTSAFCFLVPHDQSLRLYRVEANLALRHFSDALADLDYLCGFRPNWTEVRHVCSPGKTSLVTFPLQAYCQYNHPRAHSSLHLASEYLFAELANHGAAVL